MAIGVIFDFAGATINNGQPMRALTDWPGGGCLSHAAGATPEALRVTDVWESPEKFQAIGEMLMPHLAQAGIQPAEPTVFPVHNFVNE